MAASDVRSEWYPGGGGGGKRFIAVLLVSTVHSLYDEEPRKASLGEIRGTQRHSLLLGWLV